jgi:hypothetical protein
MAAIGTRAEHRLKETVEMTRDRMEPHTARHLALDIRHQRQRRLLRRNERRGLAEQKRIDGEEPPWFLIGSAAHHDAIDLLQMLPRRLKTGNAAVQHDRQAGMRCLETKHDVIVQRWDVAVLAR